MFCIELNCTGRVVGKVGGRDFCGMSANYCKMLLFRRMVIFK